MTGGPRGVTLGTLGPPVSQRPGFNGKQGRSIVAYIPCYACGYRHKNIPQAEIVKILMEFQEGFAQTVGPDGIISSKCLLDILELPPTQRKMRTSPHGKPLMSNV
jgi:hypothetical protein